MLTGSKICALSPTVFQYGLTVNSSFQQSYFSIGKAVKVFVIYKLIEGGSEGYAIKS